MKHGLIATLVALGVAAASGAVWAQAAARKDYQPEVGQAGKDVIWVPTPEALVDKMLTMAKVTASDFVIDLGSGDGRTVIMAAKKYGARAQGIEYNPDMVALSTRRAQEAGVTDKARFMKADIFESDFSQATVITMYLLPELNLRLRPKLLDMKAGTRLVSHAFTMGEWEPDERAEVEGRSAMLWIVPAKVQGNWTLRQPGGSTAYDLTLTQQFQTLTGTVRQGSYSGKIDEGKLRGESISFTFADASGTKRRFVGKVAGDKMEGALDAGNVAEMKWSGERKR
jgi:hypothetical protein